MRQALTWQEMPILAICLGTQELNVAAGGTLLQHLPELEGRLEHRRLEDDERSHPVTITPGTVLADILGNADIVANTSHHQALDRLGDGLRIVARAPDGTVEAVEPDTPTQRFLLGIQWHPERITDKFPHNHIFSAFVDACRKRGAQRCKTHLSPLQPEHVCAP
jgi:putative glutamine amidotransferase